MNKLIGKYPQEIEVYLNSFSIIHGMILMKLIGKMILLTNWMRSEIGDFEFVDTIERTQHERITRNIRYKILKQTSLEEALALILK